MFELSDQLLDCPGLRLKLNERKAGAVSVFEGVVRNHNDGRDVQFLEYEAYEELACFEGRQIIREALDKFAVYQCLCAHRTGSLAIGEIAVWVGVSAAHRAEAFEACRYIIDEIKQRLPIWKKEHYVTGEAHWVNCRDNATDDGRHLQGSHELLLMEPEPVAESRLISIDERQLYARQLILPEVGEAGQSRLSASSILVVGVGGLGSAALLYLAGAGVGTIGICEPDRVEISNLHRQVVYDFSDIGKSKAEVAADVCRQKNPLAKVVLHKEALTARNAQSLIERYDLILDCADNFTTKFALNDACLIRGKALITASVYQFEGQLSILTPEGHGQCLRCLWTSRPAEGCVGDCAEAGILGAVVGVFGTMQATEAIKYICGVATSLKEHLLLCNLIDWSMQLIRIRRDPNCSACAPGTRDDHMEPQQQWQLDILELSGSDLARYELIDIREPEEESARHLWSLLRCQASSMPLSQFDTTQPPLDRGKEYIFVCQKGFRSQRLVERLRQAGFDNTYSLIGGLDAVRKKFIA